MHTNKYLWSIPKALGVFIFFRITYSFIHTIIKLGKETMYSQEFIDSYRRSLIDLNNFIYWVLFAIFLILIFATHTYYIAKKQICEK